MQTTTGIGASIKRTTSANLPIPWNDSVSGKLSSCSRDGQAKLKQLPMRSRPQGSLTAIFLSTPP